MDKVMSVYVISNGYLLQVHGAQPRPVDGGPSIDTKTTIYAKDAKGIANEIIAAQARLKLDLPEQMEMFGPNVNLGKKERK
jgi:hypothetical protein